MVKGQINKGDGVMALKAFMSRSTHAVVKLAAGIILAVVTSFRNKNE
jgi:hypothetical protein